MISLWSRESLLLLKSLLQHHSSKASNVLCFFFLAGCTFYFVNDLCISSHTTLLGHPGTFGILNLRHFESRNVHGEEDTERCVGGNVEGGTGEPERAAGVPSPGCRRRAVRSLSV